MKATIVLASMLGSTYLALMQRSKFILNIIKGKMTKRMVIAFLRIHRGKIGTDTIPIGR